MKYDKKAYIGYGLNRLTELRERLESLYDKIVKGLTYQYASPFIKVNIC